MFFIFFLFLYKKKKTYDVGYSIEGPQWVLLMSTHNMCFSGEIRKISTFLVEKKSTLSVAMIYCGYSLEGPHQGASNEYLNCMFLWKNLLVQLRFTCPKIAIILISQRKCMLWMFIRSAMVRHFK